MFASGTSSSLYPNGEQVCFNGMYSSPFSVIWWNVWSLNKTGDFSVVVLTFTYLPVQWVAEMYFLFFGLSRHNVFIKSWNAYLIECPLILSRTYYI